MPLVKGEFSPKRFRALLDWWMCSDPWPIPEPDGHHDHLELENMMSELAEQFGYTDWVEAFHMHER